MRIFLCLSKSLKAGVLNIFFLLLPKNLGNTPHDSVQLHKATSVNTKFPSLFIFMLPSVTHPTEIHN